MLMLQLSQVMDMVVMEAMVMEDLMEAMVVTEAMVVIDMERERLKLMLSLDMVTVVMVDMVMEDLMEDMDMERETLRQVMDMVVMEDLMEVMVDTEAMAIVVMVMESNELTFQKYISNK